MLDRKGQFLDFQIVTAAQQAIDVNAEGVSSQFRVKAGTEPSESVCVVGFDREFCFELTGDCFDYLADRVVEA